LQQGEVREAQNRNSRLLQYLKNPDNRLDFYGFGIYLNNMNKRHNVTHNKSMYNKSAFRAGTPKKSQRKRLLLKLYDLYQRTQNLIQMSEKKYGQFQNVAGNKTNL
jgi:hypothetical protein